MSASKLITSWSSFVSAAQASNSCRKLALIKKKISELGAGFPVTGRCCAIPVAAAVAALGFLSDELVSIILDCIKKDTKCFGRDFQVLILVLFCWAFGSFSESRSGLESLLRAHTVLPEVLSPDAH